MFNVELFTDSIKPKIDLSDRTKRTFAERHKPKFKPKVEKDVKFYSDSVLLSKHDKELKFTNFYSEKTKNTILERLIDLGKDAKIIRDFPANTVRFNNNRITDIFKLYFNDFNPDVLGEDRIMKVTMLDPFGLQDGLRVFFLLNNELDAYEIILIDLFHLVIPSDHRDNKGKKIINKDQMLKISYSQNQHNKMCISNYFDVKIEEPV